MPRAKCCKSEEMMYITEKNNLLILKKAVLHLEPFSYSAKALKKTNGTSRNNMPSLIPLTEC